MKYYLELGYEGWCETHGLLRYHEMEYMTLNDFFYSVCLVCRKYNGEHKKHRDVKERNRKYIAGQFRRLSNNFVRSKLREKKLWPKKCSVPPELVEFYRVIILLKRYLRYFYGS